MSLVADRVVAERVKRDRHRRTRAEQLDLVRRPAGVALADVLASCKEDGGTLAPWLPLVAPAAPGEQKRGDRRRNPSG